MTYQELRAENAALKEQLAQLYKLISGFKSERFVKEDESIDQLNLFVEDAPLVAEPQQQEVTYTRKKPSHQGRTPLPDHLPVEEVVIEPEQDTSGLKKIGEQITETLEYTPASLVKKRIIRPKYATKDQGVLMGDLPSRPIEKSIAEASLLAYILVSKYVDHTPFYRQAQIFNRDFGWQPAQSTLCDWMAGCCQLLEPLYNALKQKILASGYIQTDETPIKVLDNNKKGATHQGYQWVYYDPVNKLVLFNYRKGRGKNGPKELLDNYQGYLQCDGYKVYDQIGKDPAIALAGCMAHARRKFHDALDYDKKNASIAMAYFQEIYQQEKQIKLQCGNDFKQRKNLRDQQVKPILNQLKEWVDGKKYHVLPKSALGKAMTYFVNQYPKLINIFDDGRIELDNNLIENAIRPLALGRKNYLFCGSHKAAQNAAIIYSLLGTCKINKINPREWLTQTLQKIPQHSVNKVQQLLPQNKKV